VDENFRSVGRDAQDVSDEEFFDDDAWVVKRWRAEAAVPLLDPDFPVPEPKPRPAAPAREGPDEVTHDARGHRPVRAVWKTEAVERACLAGRDDQGFQMPADPELEGAPLLGAEAAQPGRTVGVFGHESRQADARRRGRGGCGGGQEQAEREERKRRAEDGASHGDSVLGESGECPQEVGVDAPGQAVDDRVIVESFGA
jgi:hypothetical protein